MKNSVIIDNCDYTVKKYSNINEISAISDEWNKLAENKGAYLPWRCFDWFKLCCEHSDYDDAKFCVYAVYNNNDIVALLPVQHIVEKYKGIIKASVARLVGNRQASLCSVVYGLADNNIKTILQTLLCVFINDSNRYDIIELDKLPVEDKVTDELIDCLKSNNLAYRINVSTVNWYVDQIDCSGKDYFGRLPSALRKDVQYCKRRLEREGDLKFLLITDKNEIDKYLDIYDSVRGSSWKAAEKDKEFIREFTKMTASKGWLRLGFLMFDGKPIAAQKWFVCQDYAHIYDVLYDENYKKYSPGKVLSQMMFEHAIDTENVTCIDYLQGDENYKKEWTSDIRDRKEITIFNHSLKGMLYYIMLVKIKPWLSSKKSK